ncbi:hypothetical protein CERSUDRAFT_111367 [Gelatoporia subvermispora B]|uniref:CID domain-containing protein n=1 Tax=Ceriporiopsis subvermispora (strain B) TaxID=914234 RepID=M2QUN5_CERS8|nr:hypothetical protein CERSUDRAFT_111367 [Gelatoporia subvermispora B]
MSLYPQSQAYSQAPYPAHGYGQPVPPPAAYHYPPPPVQPVFHVDPSIFRRDYMTRLNELTINSRPVIQSLSMIAQDFTRYAEIVVQCIETHIRRVPAWMKLPAFYLLDAISKNVYDPYARYFTPVVVQLFLETYEQVDQDTRRKMEEMLLTWRTGAPNGRELFGVVPQVAIERQIWSGDQTTASSSRHPSTSTGISAGQVLSELDFVLGQRERALQSNSYDKTAQNHVAVLQQLRKLVQAGVSQPELSQILNQLRALAPPAAVSSQPSPPPAAIPSYSQPPFAAPVPAAYPGPADHVTHPAQVQSPQSPYPSTFDGLKHEPVELPALTSQTLPTPTAAPAASAAPPLVVNNITNLYNALLKAGVVSASATPTGAGATAKAEEATENVDPARAAAREHRKKVLSQKVKLTSTDINKQRSEIVHFLYQRLPTQCKQCGIRFPEGSTAKKNMEDHMDMHFRQNRKAGQAVGRGHSRSWFVSVEDWTHDGAIDGKGKGRANGSRLVTSSAAQAAETAQREAELRAMFVVVPPGDEAKSISCPICKEPLKSEFMEDDEEWVWQNAVRKDDKIYHATCHAEALASKTSLAVRLRNEVSSRSRSLTPERRMRTTPPRVAIPLDGGAKVPGSPSGSPARSSTKRKAEDDETSGERTPPTKKLAAEPA